MVSTRQSSNSSCSSSTSTSASTSTSTSSSSSTGPLVQYRMQLITGQTKPPMTLACKTSDNSTDKKAINHNNVEHIPMPSTSSASSSSTSSSSTSAMVTSIVALVHAEENGQSPSVNLLDLPLELLQKILGYLDYNKIARLRLVCHQMDKVCGSILNSTFQRLQKQMFHRFQAIKAQMPRRESARRNHPLACESDIIETLHMRLTLLQMSFGKHIERKHCCFFPGEILDEVYRILHYIKVTPTLARPYQVTDELFDLSTMAMEYFKDCIEPRLPEIPYFGAEFLDYAAPLSVTDGKTRGGNGSGGESSPSRSGNDEPGSSGGLEPVSTPPQSNMVLRKRIRKIKQGMKRYNSQLSFMRRDLRNCKAKIAEQQKQISEYATRLDDNDKKNEETSRKFSTLLQELNKCKTELQYWRSKSPAIPVCFGCGQSIPLPTEEQQALANQGVLSNVEASGSDDLEFIPIDVIAVNSPTEQEATQAQQQQAHQHQSNCISNSCSSSSATASTSESMAPPKAPPVLSSSSAFSSSISSSSTSSSSMPLISSKRKSSSTYNLDGESSKKPRRALKPRQAKRSKL